MRHNEFCIVLLVASPTLALSQRIPGRDLFEFPLGSLAEGSALSLSTHDGFRNPASIMLATGARARFSISSLTSGTEQGVAGQIVGIAYAAPHQITAGLTIARAEVSGILRTESDPQSVGGDVPYNTYVVSAVAARRPAPNIVTGVALRYQAGEMDVTRESAIGIDAGIVVDGLVRDGRLGLTSFLWRPGITSGDGAAFAGSVDGRVIGIDSLAQVRASYSFIKAPGVSSEHFISASGRLSRWEGRAGIARSEVGTRAATRTRLAVGLHYADYVVGVAREDTSGGLAPVYHFTLVVTVRSQ